MGMTLNVYTDETFTEVDKKCEADRLTIPYRVCMRLLATLDGVNLDSDDDVLKLITNNVDKFDPILKATFKITDSELELVNALELIEVIKELFKFTTEKISSIKGGESKNLQGTV